MAKYFNRLKLHKEYVLNTILTYLKCYCMIKHKNDIFRLIQLLNGNEIIDVPPQIRKDICDFLEIIKYDNIDVKALTNNSITYNEAIKIIKRIYKV